MNTHCDPSSEPVSQGEGHVIDFPYLLALAAVISERSTKKTIQYMTANNVITSMKKYIVYRGHSFLTYISSSFMSLGSSLLGVPGSGSRWFFNLILDVSWILV